jgi:hypothetical protein
MTIFSPSNAEHSAQIPYLLDSTRQPLYNNAGMFKNARNFTVTGTVVDASYGEISSRRSIWFI